MPALQHFFDAERIRRGWSIRETARRSQISVSKAYAIVNGDDNVELETFENIAIAFGMTPAQMATAMYHSGDLTADQVAAAAAIGQMPAEKRPVAIEMLWGLAVQPTAHPPMPRTDVAAKRARSAMRKLDTDRLDHPDSDSDGGLLISYEHPGLLDTIGQLLFPRALAAPSAS